MKRTFSAVAIVSMLASGGLSAEPQADAPAPATAGVMVDTDAQRIFEQQTGIRRDVMAQRGRYRELSGPDRERLLLTQERVLRSLEGRALTTELSPVEQRTLFNDLEEISAIVNRAEDERMICERSRPIGSNRPVTVCKTVAQRRAERERMQDMRSGRDARCEGGCPNETGLGDWR